MDLKKMHEAALRNAVSEKTNPKPYSDSRCYRKEKETIQMEPGEAVKFGIYTCKTKSSEDNK